MCEIKQFHNETLEQQREDLHQLCENAKDICDNFDAVIDRAYMKQQNGGKVTEEDVDKIFAELHKIKENQDAITAKFHEMGMGDFIDKKNEEEARSWDEGLDRLMEQEKEESRHGMKAL